MSVANPKFTCKALERRCFSRVQCGALPQDPTQTDGPYYHLACRNLLDNLRVVERQGKSSAHPRQRLDRLCESHVRIPLDIPLQGAVLFTLLDGVTFSRPETPQRRPRLRQEIDEVV
jgi:hypothetical protein